MIKKFKCLKKTFIKFLFKKHINLGGIMEKKIFSNNKRIL